MSVDQYVAQLLDRAPEATAEQRAKLGAILPPVKGGTTPNLPVLVGAA